MDLIFTCNFLSDGPYLQKLAKFETCTAPAGTLTRNTYKLTGGDGFQATDRKKIIDSLCAALDVHFEDTTQGIIHATSPANFKLWPMEEHELEGSHANDNKCA